MRVQELDKTFVHLRLLPREIDRYAPGPRAASDGAIFLFANGRNPALLLVVETDGKESAIRHRPAVDAQYARNAAGRHGHLVRAADSQLSRLVGTVQRQQQPGHVSVSRLSVPRWVPNAASPPVAENQTGTEH